ERGKRRGELAAGTGCGARGEPSVDSRDGALALLDLRVELLDLGGAVRVGGHDRLGALDLRIERGRRGVVTAGGIVARQRGGGAGELLAHPVKQLLERGAVGLAPLRG